MVWHDVAQNATVFYEGVAFFCASKGTRQLGAPRQTYLREAVLLRNSCHCLTLSLKTSFQTISAIANNLQFGKRGAYRAKKKQPLFFVAAVFCYAAWLLNHFIN